jgi:hypothetical protein
MAELPVPGIPYRVYSLVVIEPGKGLIIPVEFNGLSGVLKWRPKHFLNYGHLEFYATSPGWDSFTETGYRSFFFAELSTESVDREGDLRAWFRDQCAAIFPEVNEDQFRLF